HPPIPCLARDQGFRRPALESEPIRGVRRPFILITAAIAANDPRFADTILSGVKDRSIYVKLAAVSGVLRCSFLRTPEVKQQLQRVLAMKSIAKDEHFARTDR